MFVDATAKPFNAGFAMLEDYLDTSIYPASLNVSGPHKLADAVARLEIPPDMHMLTFEDEGIIHAFPMRLVLCYNVIQSTNVEKGWFLSFCNACNTGMVFDPVMDGKPLHFRRRGAYDGMLLVWDAETQSYWQHITGECLHGTSAGKKLRLITATRHMTSAEVLAQCPDARFYTSPLTPDQERLTLLMEKMRANPGRVAEGIASTIQTEDSRRPRFELGLGVWNGRSSKFFPLPVIAGHDNVIITEFSGRRMLIYHQLDSMSPVAVYVEANKASWNREALRLDNGDWIKDNQYHTVDGGLRPLDSPLQMLMRWYGFASTFPGCEVMADTK